MLRRWLPPLCLIVICGGLVTGCRARRSYPEQLKLTRGQMIEHLRAGFASEDPNLYWLLFDVSEKHSNYCQLGVLARHLLCEGPEDPEEVNIQATHASDGKSLWLRNEDGRVCILTERGWEVRRLAQGEQLNDRNEVDVRASGSPGGDDGISPGFLSGGTTPSTRQVVRLEGEREWRRKGPRVFPTASRIYEITFPEPHQPTVRVYRITQSGLRLDRVVDFNLTWHADQYGACYALDFNPRSEELLLENERDLAPDQFLVCRLRDGSVKKLDTRDGFPLGYLDRDIFRWDEAVLADTPVPFAAEGTLSGSAVQERP